MIIDSEGSKIKLLIGQVSVEVKQTAYLAPNMFHLWSVCLWRCRLRSHGHRTAPDGHKNFLDRCFKRKYTSKRKDIQELLEKAEKKLFKLRSVDPDCPLSNINPKKEETYNELGNNTAHLPEIKSDRFKNQCNCKQAYFRYNL